MELVDIVDKNLHILYTVTKKEAHEKGLLHKTVISEVINSNGEFVLVEQNKQKQDAGQIVSPVGGHVSAGESDEEALKREAFEESGLKDFKFKLKGKAIYNREILGRKENHYFILYELYSDDDLILNDESVQFKRFSKDGLKNELKDHPKRFGAPFHFLMKNFYPEIC